MSAAEKLKTLEVWFADEDNFGESWAEASEELVDALPQIVAVVEAAERERSPHHADYWTSDQKCPLCNALAALDEALT